MKINTIIFDCGDVIVHGILGVEKKFAPIFHVKKKYVVNGILGGEKKRLLFEGKISEKEFWKRTLEQHKHDLPISFLMVMIRKNFREIPGVKRIIKELKPHYKLGMLSDNCVEWAQYLEKKHHLRKLFGAVSYSYQTGVRKNHVKAYKISLKKLKSKPKNTLFIDDLPKNLAIARKLGLRTIEFHTAEILRKQLKEKGIKISER